jgi:hypothetical protein
MIEVEKGQINCGIFRHGYFKLTNKQIPPHSTEEECLKYVSNEEIYGCGKPFKIELINNKINISICDYI